MRQSLKVTMTNRKTLLIPLFLITFMSVLGGLRLITGHAEELYTAPDNPYLVASQVPSQSKHSIDPSTQRSVIAVRKRPSLGVDYSRVAKFKLASRKSSYRVGEMISLDLAILNSTNARTFFLQILPSTITLSAYDESGVRVGVYPFTIHQLGVSQDLYTVLNPSVIAVGTFHLLVGCSEQATFLESKDKILNDGLGNKVPGDSDSFEHNLFVDWGDGCFKVERAGHYTITAEIANTHVIVSSFDRTVKTAVGTLRSTPFTLRIID
jgi:hypothetical protein